MKDKTVLLDISTVVPKPNSIVGYYVPGIGQATISLVDALNEMKELPFNIELYSSGYINRTVDFSRWSFKGHKLPIPGRIRNRFDFVEPALRSLICNYDLYYIPSNYAFTSKKEPFIVTIHDCTDLDKTASTDVSEEKRKRYIEKYNFAAYNSKAIVTISNYSKSEILKYFNVEPEKVIVNYHGIDRKRFKIQSKEEIQTVLNKFDIRHPFFFACSCSRPRKNLITALRAFRKFRTTNPEHIFVVAWSNPFPELQREFAKEISEGSIRFLPFLSDSEIVSFYNGASLSVYVSRKEGFGLPILESFACGTPCMTCPNSSLPEVGQDAAIYVGEDNVDEMVDVMKIFENSSFDYGNFKNKSENVLCKFTWENTAKNFLKICNRNF